MNTVPQLMVLHGLGATTNQFNGMFDAHFPDAPIAMNMPGHGDRPRENGRASFDRFSALALDALDQLQVGSRHPRRNFHGLGNCRQNGTTTA